MSNGQLIRNLYDAFARGDAPRVGTLAPQIRRIEAEKFPSTVQQYTDTLQFAQVTAAFAA